MDTTEIPKTPREEWEEIIKNAHVVRKQEDRQMLIEIDEDLIKIALESSDALAFHERVKRVKGIDPPIGWTFDPQNIPRKYILIMEIINERARKKIEQKKLDSKTKPNKFLGPFRKLRDQLTKLLGS